MASDFTNDNEYHNNKKKVVLARKHWGAVNDYDRDCCMPGMLAIFAS